MTEINTLNEQMVSKIDLDKINADFYDACYFDRLEEAELLLNQGADINYRSGANSYTIGKTALGSKIIEAFYDSKSSFATNSNEKTDKYGYPDNDHHYQMIEFLVKNGADLEIDNYDDHPKLNGNEYFCEGFGKGTALYIAAATENYNVSELLIKNGANINTKDWGNSCELKDLLIDRNSATDQKLLAFIEKNELEKLIELTAEVETLSLGNTSVASLPVQPTRLVMSQAEIDHAALLAMLDEDNPEVELTGPAKAFVERSEKIAKLREKSTDRDNELSMGL